MHLPGRGDVFPAPRAWAYLIGVEYRQRHGGLCRPLEAGLLLWAARVCPEAFFTGGCLPVKDSCSLNEDHDAQGLLPGLSFHRISRISGEGRCSAGCYCWRSWAAISEADPVRTSSLFCRAC